MEEKLNVLTYEGKELEVIVTPYQARIESVGTVDSPKSSSIINATRHCCGAQGYDSMLGDSCPGCEESREHRGIIDSLRDSIDRCGGMAKYYESSTGMGDERIMRHLVADVFKIDKRATLFNPESELDELVCSAFENKMDDIHLSDHDENIIKQYYDGVHVYIFKYQKSLQPYLRHAIDNFGGYWCNSFDYKSISYTEFETTNRYFEDIYKSVLLKDFYGKQMVHGMNDVEAYIKILRSEMCQKHVILPKMLEFGRTG